MLVFPSQLSSASPTFSGHFSDHIDAETFYTLPTGVTLSMTPADLPAFFLLRYGGDFSTAKGGFLQLQLQFEPLPINSLPDAGKAVKQYRAVAFARGYFRVRVRSPDLETALETSSLPEDLSGAWHSLALGRETLATTTVELSTHEADILKQLLEDGLNSVEVELDLRYQGLVIGKPWLVTADILALKSHLLANLGESWVSAEQVIAAFLSFPDVNAPVKWRSLQPDTSEILREDILTEAAWRALTESSDILFQSQSFQSQSASARREPELYRLRPVSAEHPTAFAWNLLTPRLAERAHLLTWQTSELAPYLANPEQRQALFPVVSQLGLFGSTEIHVINHLLFDSHYLQEIRVSLRFSGSAGVPEYRDVVFNSHSSVLAQLRVAFPAFSPFKLDYQITAVLAPPGGAGWPVLIKREFTAAEGSVIEIDRQAVGVEMVRLVADPGLFDRCSAIAVELWPEIASKEAEEIAVEKATIAPVQLTLTADRTTAQVALPGIHPDTPLKVKCTATGPTKEDLPNDDLPDYVMMTGAVINREVRLASHLLEVLAPDDIELTLADPADQFAFVAVAVAPADAPEDDEGRLYPLTVGKSRHWPLLRASVFEGPQFRYAIHYVAYDKEGQSQPMAITKWAIATGTSLLVNPPVHTSLTSN